MNGPTGSELAANIFAMLAVLPGRAERDRQTSLLSTRTLRAAQEERERHAARFTVAVPHNCCCGGC